MPPSDDADSSLDLALDTVAKVVADGKCVLFLGAGVHAWPENHPPYTYADAERPRIGSELSKTLAAISKYEERFHGEDLKNLARVAQDFEAVKDRPALGQAIRDAVQGGKRPSAVVRALAELDFRWIITTNYDNLFERALALARKQPFVSIYKKDSETADDWNFDREASADEPFLFKIHGDLARPESMVVTDEDYIDFLLRMGSTEYPPVPETIRVALRRCSTLFIGYSLRDYNLRLLFKTLRWRLDPAKFPRSYSVDFKPDPLIVKVYEQQRQYIDFLALDVWSFVPQLYRRLKGREMPV